MAELLLDRLTPSIKNDKPCSAQKSEAMIKLEAVNLDEKLLVHFQLAHHCYLLFTVVNSAQAHNWTIRCGTSKLFLTPGLP